MASGGEPPSGGAGARLAPLAESARRWLSEAHLAREESLRACRETIRACSLSIRAVHRREDEEARERAEEAEESLRRAQRSLAPFPRLAAAGFLHDAEKEYAEARLTSALVAGGEVPGPDRLDVSVPAWLNGLAEAASELRRHLLDRMRDDDVRRAEELLGAMGDCYDLLVTIDFPDALTGGLRRTTDALRAVLERSRSDVTTTVLQSRLQESIDDLVARLAGSPPTG